MGGIIQVLLNGDANLAERIESAIIGYGYGPLWFLPAMFFASILFVFFQKKKYQLLGTILTMLLGCFCSASLSFMPPVSRYMRIVLQCIGRASIGASFMFVGYYLHAVLEKVPPKAEKWMAVVGGVIFLTVFQFSKADLHFSIIGNPIIYYSAGITGSFIVIYFAKSMGEKSKILQYFGRNSLIIMATHTLFPWEISWLLVGITKLYRINNSVVISICVIVFTMLIEFFLIEAINKNRFMHFLISYKPQKEKPDNNQK